MRHAIGIDIGGTKIEAALVSDDAAITQIVRHDTPQTANDTAKLILEITQQLTRVQPDVLGVGLSIPGSLHPQTGVLRNAPNSPAINNTDFFVQLKKSIPVETRIENDANCLILGEVHFGVAQGCKNAVGLIMGTGFGSGVYLNQLLFVGQSGLAPELGHTILEANGRECLCGNRGCVEAYLSGPSILKRYIDVGGNSCRTTAEIFRSSETLAKNVLAETLYYFDRFVAMLVSIYDPEMIVLGGGLSLQPAYYDREKYISQYQFGSRDQRPVRAARFGDASGKLGAAALFFGE